MAKKSHKQTTRPKRDNPGCMSGLISMFDFRQGRHTQKLLTDKKYGSKHGEGTLYSNNKLDVQGDLEDSHEDAIDTDPKEIGRFSSSKTSLKALIEEEMSESYISEKISTKDENARAHLVSETNLEKNHKKERKKYRLGSDHDANESICSNLSGSTPFDIKLAESMEVLCCEDNKCHENNVDNVSNRKNNFRRKPDLQYALDHSILQKALGNFTKALLDQKSLDTKQSVSDGESQSTKFMDPLQMLNSNKKHIVELPNGQIETHGSRYEEQIWRNLFNKQNGHHSFKRKNKSEEEKASLALNRIVLLTPSPVRNQQNSNTSSPIPSSILHHNSQHHEGNERGSFNFSLKKIKRRIRNMIGESKKERHLITMDGILHKVPYGYQNSDSNSRSYYSHEHAGGENGILPTTRASITLGRLLSLPEYNLTSPWLSPEREEGNDSPKEMRFFPVKLKHTNSSNMSPLTQTIRHSTSTASNTIEDNQALDSNPASLITKLHTGEVLIQEGNNEIHESDHLEVSTEGCKIEGSCMISELGAHKEPQTQSVSVLPLDQNLIASKANSRTCMDDKEAKLEYVRTVLEASGLSHKHFTDNLQSSNQLLDPFVFDEVEISFGREMDDSRLLFDCVNEVLLEIHERYVSFTPWASFIRPNISTVTIGGNFVQEVCKQFDWYFCLQFPCTMDQVVRKDLDCRTWMDLHFETERTIAETGEVILEYMMEEIILELWD